MSIINRIREKFPNFLLGLTVVVLAILLGSILLQNKSFENVSVTKKITDIFKSKEEPATVDESTRSYTVKDGDTLWSIAEEAYGSGYNASDIAKANKLQNPDVISPGLLLAIPALEPKTPTKGEIASGVFTTSSDQEEAQQPPNKSYVVKEGDSLWSISLQKYGNPYKWTDVWNLNPQIQNPDLIYPNDTIIIFPS